MRLRWSVLLGIVLCGAVAQEWQQGVSYAIRAVLVPAETLLTVQTRMVYRNNSPDTLRELYVHLYWNIFAPQSYARQLSRERRLEQIPELPPVRIDSFVVIASTGERRTDFSVDNTIVRLPVPKPLAPGDSLVVLSSIAQKVPPEGLRMGRFEQDYFIANWFPSVCVYDRYGWHTEQYLGTGEFFEEIADFEVELTLPGTYGVVHTGVLLNPDEVFPEEVRQALQRARRQTQPVRIADFSARPLSDTVLKTWRFRAERVRTVAWAAVRRYLWDAQQWDGILVHVLYPKRLESFYRDEGLRAAVHAVRYFSEHFGRYPYSDLVVIVGGTTGGMEYPGIVFIGRGLGGGVIAPWTVEVIMHEIGHNWYPMVVNSNETEFGFQDEGFNTFITTLALEAFYGRWAMGLRVPGWLRFLIPAADERTRNAVSTILWQLRGWDEPLLTRSDWYRTVAGYSVNSYPKTASLLFMLRGVLGQETFAELMQEYFRRYRFRHVYPEDFARLASEIALRREGQRVDLRWFFDRWFAQTPVLDYAFGGLRNVPVGPAGRAPTAGSLWDVTVALDRRGSAIMPVDVELLLATGQRYRLHFGVDEVLRGPRRVEKTIRLPAPAIRAVVDPDTVLLLDINRLNNSSGLFPPVRVRFFLEALSSDPVELSAYGISWQPALGFNNRDGLKLGVELRGAYLGFFHQFHLSVLQGMRVGPQAFNVLLRWGHLLWQLPGRPFLEALLARQDGWWRFRGGASWQLTPEPPSPWELTGRIAAGMWLQRTAEYAFPGSPLAARDRQRLLLLRAAARLRGDFPAGSLQLYGSLEPGWYAYGTTPVVPLATEWGFIRGTAELILQPDFPFPVVLRGALGGFLPSAPEFLPVPLGFRRASVAPLEELELPLYRAPGIVSPAARRSRTAPVGGAFLRGYVAQDTVVGSTLTALNVELGLSPLLRLLPGGALLSSLLEFRLFADGGAVGERWAPFREWLWDGGVSCSLQLMALMPTGSEVPLLQRLRIDELALDFPLYLSHPPAGERRWAFRWTVRFRSLLRTAVGW